MIKTISSQKYLRLVAWLKKERQSKGVSMRDLGTLLGRSHQFIGKIENMERRLDVYEYVQYCSALQLDPVTGIELLQQA